MAELARIEGGRGSGHVGLPAVTAPPSPSEWNAMKQQAQVIARSGLAPKAVSTPEKILVIAMKARELSLPPMQGLSHIHIVEGRPALSAELMVALVQRAGHKLRVLETSSQKCVVEGVRADDPRHPSRVEWTMEDAQRAGVANKGPWKSYPAAMLRARAISALCRFAFADVLMGAA
ncbi:MAG: recombinase RecT, partial [Actinomycetota bacterium]|nr:recombinase RecT [Actinomycetota bacterium]